MRSSYAVRVMHLPHSDNTWPRAQCAATLTGGVPRHTAFDSGAYVVAAALMAAERHGSGQIADQPRSPQFTRLWVMWVRHHVHHDHSREPYEIERACGSRVFISCLDEAIEASGAKALERSLSAHHGHDNHAAARFGPWCRWVDPA
jgi:hypothetical protein